MAKAKQQEAPAIASFAAAQYQEHQGPIPDPESLARYQEIHPEVVPWIVQRATSDQEHYQKLEAQALEAEVEDRAAARREFRHGQTLAFCIMMTMIIAGAAIIIWASGPVRWAGVVAAIVPGIPRVIDAFTGRGKSDTAKASK